MQSSKLAAPSNFSVARLENKSKLKYPGLPLSMIVVFIISLSIKFKNNEVVGHLEVHATYKQTFLLAKELYKHLT